MIQPHGALLFVDESDLVVLAASENATAIAGGEISFDPASAASIRRALADARGEPFSVGVRGNVFDASVHRVAGGAVIELEPAGAIVPASTLVAAGERMFAARTLRAAAAIAAEEIAAITGFARVAVYRFDAGAASLLAGTGDDAPGAHHALAPETRLQHVVDRGAVPVAVPAKVDLSRAVLRAPASAGTGASLTIALDGLGVIACDDPAPRFVSASQRATCAAIARFLAWQLASAPRTTEHGTADEFIATVSHELRTPLNALIGWLQLITAGQVAPERTGHALATATRNARVLAGLVDDMLDVSRIVTGKMRLDMQLVSSAPLVDAALATIQPAADAKRLRIETALDADAGHVLVDPRRMQQVISNLLVNAVKFTPDGGAIRVALRRGSPDAGTVEIEIADTGAGIDGELLPHVFERYRQGQRGTGLGLGLAIVRELVDLHGGNVTAASDGVGKGATFVVALPRAAAHTTAPTPVVDLPAEDSGAASFEPIPQLRGLRALVVDDDPECRELMEAVLSSSEVAVEHAATASDAIVAMTRGRFGVLIADVGLPGIDGYELIQQVRGLPEPACRVPAIAVTAHARSHDRARAFLAGFDVHVAKPIDPNELLAVVVGVTGRRTQSRPTIDPGARPLEGARLLVVDDDVDNREMLGALLEESGATVALASSAGEGLAAVAEFRPDVLLSDLGLPDKDGLMFIRELRAAGPERGGWVPAIAISGRAGQEEARAAILAGFQLLLSKPFDPTDLVRRLVRLVRRNQT